MIDRIIEFVVSMFILRFVLVYTAPYIVNSINYVGDQIQRIDL